MGSHEIVSNPQSTSGIPYSYLFWLIMRTHEVGYVGFPSLTNMAHGIFDGISWDKYDTQ